MCFYSSALTAVSGVCFEIVGQQYFIGDQIIFDPSVDDAVFPFRSVTVMWQIGAAVAPQACGPAQSEVLPSELQQKEDQAWNHRHHFTLRAAEICHLSPGASIGRKKAPSTNKSDSPPSWAGLCQRGESPWSACTARWFYRWWTESSDWLRLRCLHSPGRRWHWENVGGRRGARCHKTGNPNHFQRRLKDTKTDTAQIVSSLEQNDRDLK